MTRELTYDPEPGETLRREPDTLLTRHLEMLRQVEPFVSDIADGTIPDFGPDYGHDVMTCPKPICIETRRMILARERGLRKD